MISTKQTLVFIFLATYATGYNIPIIPVSYIDFRPIVPQYLNLPSQLMNPQVPYPKCYNMDNKWHICHNANPKNLINVMSNEDVMYLAHLRPRDQLFQQFMKSDGYNTLTTSQSIIQNSLKRSSLSQTADSFNLLPIQINIPAKSSRSSNQYSEPSANENIISPKSLISAFDNNYPHSRFGESAIIRVNIEGTKTSTMSSPLQQSVTPTDVYNDFFRGLDHLERRFYAVTFDKLTMISPENRKENGISFVQSGLFLLMGLIALSSEVDFDTRQEIEKCINIQLTESDKLSAVSNIILSSLPPLTNNLKFRWSTRLILWPNHTVSEGFKTGPATALQMHIDLFNGTETPQKIADILNDYVEIDSGGSIRNTFEEDDLSEGAQAILLTTLYLRGRWRSAPTLLNGSRLFRDTVDTPTRSLRYIRINDVMRYADLAEWDAEAIEISYATPGLSLLMLVPRRISLRRLANHVATTSIHYITQRMHSIRIAVTMPLYTLRMTLLLPNKLQAMGISRLVDRNNTTPRSLTLSHAVQRLMFWAEAGRNAFKDDGIEWDETPELELVVDRPYIFFVRWRNLTLMNGNFVL